MIWVEIYPLQYVKKSRACKCGFFYNPEKALVGFDLLLVLMNQFKLNITEINQNENLFEYLV